MKKLIEDTILHDFKLAKLLLKVAVCPHPDCDKGHIPEGPDPDGGWSCYQCQWCYERDSLL